MSQENIEVVRAIFEATRATWMPFVSCTTLDVIMRPLEDWPDAETLGGREAVMRGLEQLRDSFESDWQELISDLVHVGDRVAVRTVWHGVGHGPELKQESTPVVTVRKGRVFHIEFFWDHAEALETLGLSEKDAQADSS